MSKFVQSTLRSASWTFKTRYLVKGTLWCKCQFSGIHKIGI